MHLLCWGGERGMSGKLLVLCALFMIAVAPISVLAANENSSLFTSYTIAGDVVVVDSKTGLVWQRETADTNEDRLIISAADPEGDMMTWQDAMIHCRDLVFAGSSDWRLPDITELSGIVDFHHTYPAVAPVFQCESSYYWSGTTVADNANKARYVHFNFGTDSSKSKEKKAFVRCVRSGK